jgi:hypothetical protein
MLNHTSGTFGGVHGIYNRYLYMAEMREAVALWEGKLASLLDT